jgi:hypothetical protein
MEGNLGWEGHAGGRTSWRGRWSGAEPQEVSRGLTHRCTALGAAPGSGGGGDGGSGYSQEGNSSKKLTFEESAWPWDA